ncbi:PKD domain-containing protein [Taibaiella koreensis]|uniref:PKD domain-containing protein n=1 Tax=Taibaiella koreensis TaxID=1268548 RepID=UPI000E5A09BB|nr:PKD domain-containing protein [Taibaiella koreensis]
MNKGIFQTTKLKALLLLAGSLFAVSQVTAADTLRVLFLGNSYTEVNNLPQVIANLAVASGDQLIYQSNTPGGQTFQQHCSNSTTLSLIAQGGWDYVVLQEQSQRPSFSDGQVANEVYPYAKKLDSLIHRASPCAKTVFYMTWGYKNGDAGNCPVWPPICTYSGMDSMLYLRYSIMAEDNEAWLSPAGRVRRRVRALNPSIELYAADGSHPTAAGTFAAALSFYTLLYGKDPVANTYNYSLSAGDAGAIKAAAKAVAFDSLSYWRRFDPLPAAGFTATTAGNTVNLANTSMGATAYSWDFGDGSPASAVASPSHTYAASGMYDVCLKAIDGCDTVKLCRKVQIGTVGIGNRGSLTELQVYPNPVTHTLYFKGLKENCDYILYNNIGVRLQQGKLEMGQAALSLQRLPAGLYYLQLLSAEGQGSTVLPVQKQ